MQARAGGLDYADGVTTAPPEALAPRLERVLQARQAERLPSIAAAVVRDGETVWSGAVGLADVEAEIEATPETQYRVGSITKTFTAVAVMQLRDEGKLDLDDRVGGAHPRDRERLADAPPDARRTSRACSARPERCSSRARPPRSTRSSRSMGGYELVLPGGTRAPLLEPRLSRLLGEVVARRSGRPTPRSSTNGSWRRSGWRERRGGAGAACDRLPRRRVHRHRGREPHVETGGVAAMGQLWSTVGDLCRWGAFLVGGREGVLAPRHGRGDVGAAGDAEPRRMDGRLGPRPPARAARTGGSSAATAARCRVPRGALVNRETKTGAAVLTNSGTRAPTGEIAIELASATIELWPPELRAVAAREPAAAGGRGDPRPVVVGGKRVRVLWRDGKLTARIVGAPPRVKPSVFEPLPDGGFRVVSGRERGERLRVEGGLLVWGGYPFTRDQERRPGSVTSGIPRKVKT